MSNINFVFNLMIWKFAKIPIILLGLVVICMMIIAFILAAKEVKE